MENRLWTLTVIVIAVVGVAAYAGTPVDQGPGNANTQEWYQNIAARRAGATTEVLVLASGPVTMPTTALVQRKSIELQNLGPNPIYCTVGGSAPVLLKSRQVPANGGTWSLGVGPSVLVKCLAATGDQVTGAATIVTEVQ